MSGRARSSLAAAACLAVSLAALADTGQERAEQAGAGLVGSRAPALVLTTLTGRTIDLGKLYGHQAVYLKFWATWCVPCRQQMPHLEHTFETAGPNLKVIAIDVGFNETRADIEAYRQELGLKVPIVLDDGHLGAAFNLRVTPQHVVIDRNGYIRYVGHLADDRLDAALRAAQAPPSPAATAGAQTHTAAAAAAAGGAAALPGTAAATAGTSAVFSGRVGERAPAAAVTALDHSVLRIGAAGTRMVLVFLSPWCESYLQESRPRRSAQCRIAREQIEKAAARGTVRWLGIASGLWASEADLTDYRNEHQVAIPLTLDASGDLFRRYHVHSVPTLIGIGPDGRIARRVEPEQAGDGDQLARQLADWVAP